MKCGLFLCRRPQQHQSWHQQTRRLTDLQEIHCLCLTMGIFRCTRPRWTQHTLPRRVGKVQGVSEDQTLSEHHVELDEVCTICLQDAHEGERMRRLICRHMFHYACWTQTVAAGPARNQERVATCPNCRGRGHVISCWHYMDTSIVTQFNPATGQEAPNMLEALGAELVNVAPQTPRKTRAPEQWLEYWHLSCLPLSARLLSTSRLEHHSPHSRQELEARLRMRTIQTEATS